MPKWPWSKAKPEVRKLREPVERHLGVALAQAQSVAHDIGIGYQPATAEVTTVKT